MRISDLLNQENIAVLLQNQNKRGIIEELLDLAMKSGHIKDRAVALEAILKREELMSTGLEKGVAVPHAKSNVATELTMALGISKQGIDFESADGEPAHLFFFLLAPESAAGPNIQALAQIARLTSQDSLRMALKNVETADEVLEIIKKFEA